VTVYRIGYGLLELFPNVKLYNLLFVGWNIEISAPGQKRKNHKVNIIHDIHDIRAVWNLSIFTTTAGTVLTQDVCLSVTRWYSVETAKHILLFSLSGSHTILVFLHQAVWQYSDGDPIMGASNAKSYETRNLAVANRSWVSCAHNTRGHPYNSGTLKSRLSVPRSRWKWKQWIDHNYATYY